MPRRPALLIFVILGSLVATWPLPAPARRAREVPDHGEDGPVPPAWYLGLLRRAADPL